MEPICEFEQIRITKVAHVLIGSDSDQFVDEGELRPNILIFQHINVKITRASAQVLKLRQQYINYS